MSDQAHRPNRPKLSIVADLCSIVSAVVLVFGFMGLSAFMARQARANARPAATQAGGRQGPVVETISNGGNLPTPEIRDTRARLALVEFTDFECPYCGRFARDVFPSIRKAFIDNGDVALVLRQFPMIQIHPFARDAAEAVECARDQGRLDSMYESLFTQPKRLGADELKAHAAQAGLDAGTFRDCMARGHAAILDEHQRVAARFGVRASPTFLIGTVGSGVVTPIRRIVGAQPAEVFETVLSELLKDRR